MVERDYGSEVGHAVLRKEVVDAMIKQTAKATYKFKQAFSIVPTNAWKNTFFREGTSVLAGQTGNAVKGIPRTSNFPQARSNWEEISVNIIKYGLETNIPWEDIISGAINVQAREIINITEGVVKAVDDQLWDEISDTQGTGSGNVIQSFALTEGKTWNAASAAIIDDLMKASELIATNGNYDTGNLICFVNPRDKRAMMNYLADKGAQWMPIATDIAKNGNIGKIAGVQIVESNSVTTSFALVCKPKTCATYKELVSLRSDVEMDPFRSLRIRVVEEGVVELTDPLAIVLIKNTDNDT